MDALRDSLLIGWSGGGGGFGLYIIMSEFSKWEGGKCIKKERIYSLTIRHSFFKGLAHRGCNQDILQIKGHDIRLKLLKAAEHKHSLYDIFEFCKTARSNMKKR